MDVDFVALQGVERAAGKITSRGIAVEIDIGQSWHKISLFARHVHHRVVQIARTQIFELQFAGCTLKRRVCYGQLINWLCREHLIAFELGVDAGREVFPHRILGQEQLAANLANENGGQFGVCRSEIENLHQHFGLFTLHAL